jgi:hypothetical protein
MNLEKTAIKSERPGMVPTPGRPRPEAASAPAESTTTTKTDRAF